MNNLETALKFGGILSVKEIDYITGFFKVLNLKKEEDFLSIGRISNRIGFVDSGVVRAYTVVEEVQEVTKYFVRENQFTVEIESFYDNKPSTSAIQAVTNCRLLTIHRSEWYRLGEEISKLYILTKTLSEAALLNKIKDNEFLLYGSAKTKYSQFMERYPDLVRVVPLQIIASYLQITPQSLSRIRREVHNAKGDYQDNV